MAGRLTKVSAVATISPPMIATAIGPQKTLRDKETMGARIGMTIGLGVITGGIFWQTGAVSPFLARARLFCFLRVCVVLGPKTNERQTSARAAARRVGD